MTAGVYRYAEVVTGCRVQRVKCRQSLNAELLQENGIRVLTCLVSSHGFASVLGHE